jgi:hypothetical protein
MSIRSNLQRMVSVDIAEKSSNSVSPGVTSISTTVKKGVFVTKESILTFPIASGVVILIWNVINWLDSNIAQLKIVPVIISFVVGMFIYYISMDVNMDRKDKVAAFGIAVVNSFMLLASAIGIDVIL